MRFLDSKGLEYFYSKLKTIFVQKAGNRGTLAGNETVSTLSGNQTITKDSTDTIVIKTNGATTLTFTAATTSVCAVKAIALHADGATTLKIVNATWINAGEAPTWGAAGKELILIAHFINGKVLLSVFHNEEA